MLTFARNRAVSVVALALLAAAAGSAHAATLTVNSTGDTPDAVAGDGTCGSALPNTCTLRAAIQEANGNAATSNTIEFASGVNAGSTTAATAYPPITKALVVTGPAGRFTVDGGAGVGLFRYTGSGGAYSVTNVDFTNGSATQGGCIYFAPVGTATFELSNSRITNCAATAGNGGGIAIDLLAAGSTVTLTGLQVGTDTDIVDPSAGPNTATGDGGGAWLRLAGTGSMTVRNSSFTFNEAVNGAGIAVRRGRLDIDGSTISDNTATGTGGGVYLDTESATGGSVRMENVTVSTNAAALGGGIGAKSDNPKASWVTFSTITQNTATTAGVAAACGRRPRPRRPSREACPTLSPATSSPTIFPRTAARSTIAPPSSRTPTRTIRATTSLTTRPAASTRPAITSSRRPT